MKNRLAFILLVGMVGLVVGGIYLRIRKPHAEIPNVTLARLNQAEADWYNLGIEDYRVFVSIEFATEQRRYEVNVVDGQFSSAASARLDEETGIWGDFSPAPEEEARFFTIPGLLEMLRSALLSEDVEREVLRFEVGPDAVPKTLFLGAVIQDGVPVRETELLIRVLEFAPAQR